MLAFPAIAAAAFSFFDPRDSAAVPDRLSRTGIYKDIATKVTDTSLHAFAINAPLWSDGAAKMRWVILPPGRSIPYNDTTDRFDYPDSATFVKTFLLERRQGDSTTRVYWETRFLMNRRDSAGENSWRGFSYRWNDEATEAYLVNPRAGFDTSFFYTRGPADGGTYKKWHFPSQSECELCHAARSVLGFLPPQLKRPSAADPAIDQVLDLFRQGIFTGPRPDAAALAARWKGLREPLPAGLSPTQRYAFLDTVARSYIAGNCSGCHGDRGISQGRAPSNVNYDFYRLRPTMEFAHAPTGSAGMDMADTGYVRLFGRPYVREAARRLGLDTAAGAPWDLVRPPDTTLPPALVYPGYPAYSTILYRQILRRAPWRDSMEARINLEGTGAPTGWSTWLFSKPWGSSAWRDDLDTHGVRLEDVISYQAETNYAGAQMPPLNASFIPDSAALAVLGEWIQGYQSLYGTGIHSAPAGRKPSLPANLFRRPGHRILFALPDGEKPRDARGRAN
ncbi:MAG: hypothetical protein JF616_05175 [Fibrobacteres bacterium]|nr:hypothetical protein [Fibrobacterota bacterium]